MQCPEQSSSLARRAADGSRRGMSPLRLCRQKGVFPRVKKCAESADLWMKFHFCSWLTTCVNFCNGQMSVLCFVYLLQFMSSNVSYLWVWSAQRWEIPDFHPFNSLKSTGRKSGKFRLCWLDKEMPMIWLFEAFWSKDCLLVFEASKMVSFLNVKCL